MKQAGAKVAEAFLLFSALLCTLSSVPSESGQRIELFPSAVVAVILFASSRLLRWRGNFFVAAAEALLFSLFVWLSNAVANQLLVS
jgi:hypothetical protein